MLCSANLLWINGWQKASVNLMVSTSTNMCRLLLTWGSFPADSHQDEWTNLVHRVPISPRTHKSRPEVCRIPDVPMSASSLPFWQPAHASLGRLLMQIRRNSDLQCHRRVMSSVPTEPSTIPSPWCACEAVINALLTYGISVFQICQIRSFARAMRYRISQAAGPKVCADSQRQNIWACTWLRAAYTDLLRP